MDGINIISEIRQSGIRKYDNALFDPAKCSTEEAERLGQLKQRANEYVDNRLIQLATIAKMMQISSEENSIGGFEMKDCTQLGFFFEEEFNMLHSAKVAASDADYYLSQYNAHKD